MEDFHNLALDMLVFTVEPSSLLTRIIFNIVTSMGECSFGNGFGQTNKKKELEVDFDEKIWRSIPSAIFKGMTRRYQVQNNWMVMLSQLLTKH